MTKIFSILSILLATALLAFSIGLYQGGKKVGIEQVFVLLSESKCDLSGIDVAFQAAKQTMIPDGGLQYDVLPDVSCLKFDSDKPVWNVSSSPDVREALFTLRARDRSKTLLVRVIRETDNAFRVRVEKSK